MRWLERRFVWILLAVCLVDWLSSMPIRAQEDFQEETPSVEPDDAPLLLEGGFQNSNGVFYVVRAVQPPQPMQPLDISPIPTQPLDTTPLPQQPLDIGMETFGLSGLISLGELGEQFDARLQNTPATQNVTGGTARTLSVADTGQLLQEANSVQSVTVQRRSPVSLDPRIRGYRAGQIYTQSDGALFLPVRPDLDTVLSKFDPALIQDVVIIPGPYGLRYGPGFGFIDVVTTPSPRYQNGYEAHSRFGTSYRANGDQLYVRETISGGSSDWGYIVSYGNRTGVDYEAGNGQFIPSGYRNRNFRGQIGLDLSPIASVELRYLRLDQTDAEYAGQFFDVDYLVTDGWSVSYVQDEDCRVIKADGWFNRTRFAGDTGGLDPISGKRTFNVINRVESALDTALNSNNIRMFGVTDGDLATAGSRATVTYGQEEAAQLSLGADVRYVEQNIQEHFSFTGDNAPGNINTNLPRADLVDPGLFTELTLPFTPYWITTMGARVDFPFTKARLSPPDGLRDDTSLPGAPGDLSQNDTLYAFYLANDVDLSQNWSARCGFGHAQRVPTLVERYADGVFLGIVQSGFSRVIGNPDLDKERAWQMDLTLQADYENFRGRASTFHSWVLDYITFIGNVISDPSGARLLRTTNTKMAMLQGFELYGELDLTARLTTFGAMNYVEGRDLQIHTPLYGISPLESRVGLRLHDPDDGQTWGLEFASRMVHGQDRLGGFRIGTTSVTGISTLETSTPGFTVFYLRGYWNVTDNFHFVGGVENLFNRTYLEHLDLRLPDQGAFTGTRVLSPGITPYVGIEWTL